MKIVSSLRRAAGSAALVAMMAFAGAASAETVNCTAITSVPYTITTPGLYCLTSDLSTAMSSGNAITIQANSVVLELNSHKIGGMAVPVPRLRHPPTLQPSRCP